MSDDLALSGMTGEFQARAQRLVFPVYLYWGVETVTPDKFLSLPWYRLAQAPWLRGRAVRVRIKGQGYHLGLCRRGKPLVREVPVDPEELRSWR